MFNTVIPANLRYSPTNPGGARATVHDHTVSVYGEHPNGFAKRALDNVGVQYGLKTLDDGVIGVDEFLLLNEAIGGVDLDFQSTTTRTVADPGTMDRVYRSGRVLNTGGGLKSIPIISQHGAGDPVVNGDIHLKFYAWSVRERLRAQNGHADNQVIVAPFGNHDDMFEQMNRWLDAVWADGSTQPLWKKVIANKPADIYDSCYRPLSMGGAKIAGPSTSPWEPNGCNSLYPAGLTPNLVAGAPLAGTILKCQLKAPDPADYAVAFTAEQWTRLNQVFATGVCDWSKPGVEESGELKTWASFGPSQKNVIFDITPQ